MYADDTRPVYVEHMLAEHRRLHAMLRRARSSIMHRGGPDQDVRPTDIARELRRIRQELASHFAEEEGGGCLEEAVSRCPRLSAEARSIQARHPELLRDIDSLIAQVEAGEPTLDARIAIEKEFDCLCDRLHAHEAAENDLLRQGFGTNINGDENGKHAPLEA
jgi:hypothetical protein